MSPRKRISTSAQATLNAETLRVWIQRTSQEQVPTNQYGRASRSTILGLLKISRSAAISNPRIAKLFAQLDARLRATPKAADHPSDEVAGNVEQHSYCIDLQRENLRLKAEVRRLCWSEDTGRNVSED